MMATVMRRMERMGEMAFFMVAQVGVWGLVYLNLVLYESSIFSFSQRFISSLIAM